MATSTDPSAETSERGGIDLATRDVVWLGAPYADGSTDPAQLELFTTQEQAEQYVESLHEMPETDCEWTAWDDGDGRQLLEATSGDSVGVVSAVETTVPCETPPFDGSILERAIPADSSVRSYLPGVNELPTIEREAVPFTLFDLLLLTERGHLRLQVGEAAGDEPTRYLDELTACARKTVNAATATSDDRIASSRIEDLDDYFRADGTTAYYGKPRYRLSKKLSDWGGETGRYATLELWLLFQLLLRLYPDHVTWEPGYEYHDDH